MSASQIHSMFVACVNGLASRIAKGDANPRVINMRKESSAHCLSLQGAQYLHDAGASIDALRAVLHGGVNPTVPYRLAQMVHAMHAGLYKQTDATTARALVALRIAGAPFNRDALNNLITGKVKIEGVSPNTRGVGVRQLDQYIARVGRGTVETQLSRSFGANGFARALGMVHVSGASNFIVSVNPDNGLTKRFFAMVDGATVGQLNEMFGGEDTND